MSRLSGTGLLFDCDTHTVNVVNQPGRVIPVSRRRTTGVAPSEQKGPMSEPAEAAAELITLDALTRRVGMSVRNIRFYATKGLVPPPIRRGRSGYYSPDHVARLAHTADA